MESADANGWQPDVVTTRTSSGQVYLLLGVRKTTCDNCRYGVHFETTWCSTTGEVNQIQWCSSCFNADCARGEMDEGLRGLWRRQLVQLEVRPREVYWSSARLAVEDLLERGLV